MKTVKKVSRIQVEGKRHAVLQEDASIEKLVRRGISLKAKMGELKEDLEAVEEELIGIARNRREGTTTVNLEGVSVQALVTFRESFQVKEEVEDIRQPLGPLFDRFFEKKTEYKTTKDFKKFIESGHALGIENPEEVKSQVMEYITTKETKPNVKMEEKENE